MNKNFALNNNLMSFDVNNLYTFSTLDFECILSKYVQYKWSLYEYSSLYIGDYCIFDISPILYSLDIFSTRYYIHLFDYSGGYIGYHEFSVFTSRNEEEDNSFIYEFRKAIIEDCKNWQSITGVESSIFYFCINNKKTMF
jgi:hypothetical protein